MLSRVLDFFNFRQLLLYYFDLFFSLTIISAVLMTSQTMSMSSPYIAVLSSRHPSEPFLSPAGQISKMLLN